ncbi:hypothetical protein BDV28DRAFT_138588 [Aspergillus coremiiformis]|uniref:Uncharacterized protein n=1 Tax=Aspergillus coremiiformis TaxID=138285 RepID=A0A5N6Z433_9EURO|nr:hypothetical protein BDV28DRAFT_138588 [Aspergillus coremiiformis]
MDGPPPPPPRHGEKPNTTHGQEYRTASDLPKGNYDIFIIPPHSSGSGFLYLPSLQCQRNSFIAGCLCTLVVVLVWSMISPIVKTWYMAAAASGDGGGMGIGLLGIGVGIAGWGVGLYQSGFGGAQSGRRERWGPGGGSGAGNAGGPQGNYAGNNGAPPGNQYSGNQYSAGPPPQTPPPNAGSGPNKPESAKPESKSQREADGEKARAEERAREERAREEKAREEKARAEREREEKARAEKEREEKARAEKEREEKAREETRRKEELRRKMEEFKRKREAEQREKQRQRERDAMEKELRERREQFEEEMAAAREAAAKEARERAEKEAADARARAEREAAEIREKEARAAAEAKEKADREAAEAKAKAEKEAAEKEAAAKAAAKKEADAKFAALKEAAAKKYAEKKAKDAQEAAAKEAAAAKAASQKAGSASVPPQTPSPKKPAPSGARTTMSADQDDAYSFRPYDRPRRPYGGTSSSSAYSESSYAPSQSTARTSPPPSNKGRYETKDPDKIVIKGVFQFNNTFIKTPAAQLVSGQGIVTDGLVLRITTEGLFIDDDIRGVGQREWDVKAWTMKLAEVWCPQYASQKHNPPKQSSFFGRREDGPTSAESDAYLVNLLKVCKNTCRLAPAGPHSEKQGLHVLRVTIRDQEGRKYLFVLEEQEGWKVGTALQRLRKGSQARALGVTNMSVNEGRSILGNLGYI